MLRFGVSRIRNCTSVGNNRARVRWSIIHVLAKLLNCNFVFPDLNFMENVFSMAVNERHRNRDFIE